MVSKSFEISSTCSFLFLLLGRRQNTKHDSNHIHGVQDGILNPVVQQQSAPVYSVMQQQSAAVYPVMQQQSAPVYPVMQQSAPVYPWIQQPVDLDPVVQQLSPFDSEQIWIDDSVKFVDGVCMLHDTV